MDEAMSLGANVVGGIPHYEWTREMGVEDVNIAFELARRYNRDIDCHCDETDDPHSRFTEVMAANTMQQGWEGRVTVSHCTAMHSWDNAFAFKLIRLLARGRMNVICNPYDNIILQGRFDTYPKRRGMARLKELLQAGVNVSLGHDSIMDPWYPLGRGDMLAAASLALHIAQMSGHDEIATMYDLVTTNAARTLNITDRYGIEEGKPANLIIVDAADAARRAAAGARAAACRQGWARRRQHDAEPEPHHPRGRGGDDHVRAGDLTPLPAFPATEGLRGDMRDADSPPDAGLGNAIPRLGSPAESQVGGLALVAGQFPLAQEVVENAGDDDRQREADVRVAAAACESGPRSRS